MELLLAAVGLILVLEGMPWFLSPARVKKVLRQVFTVPDSALRLLGLVAMLLGLLLVHLATG